jgi:hypothetical protein
VGKKLLQSTDLPAASRKRCGNGIIPRLKKSIEKE